ncbi:MAG TPA: hypothetical protein VGG25_31260 [Streptosporangiaceae bacterium]|jgi:hypothetical protein
MELLSKSERVVARILAEMDRQRVTLTKMAGRMGPGWSYDLLAIRLGHMLPGGRGGRYPLTSMEITVMARALKVPVRHLVSGAR